MYTTHSTLTLVVLLKHIKTFPFSQSHSGERFFFKGGALARAGNCTQSEVFNCWGNPSCCDSAATCYAKLNGVAICKRSCSPGRCHVVAFFSMSVAEKRDGQVLSVASDINFLSFPMIRLYHFISAVGVDERDPEEWRSPWSCEVHRSKNESVPSIASTVSNASSVEGQSKNLTLKKVTSSNLRLSSPLTLNTSRVTSLTVGTSAAWCSASFSQNCLNKPNCCDGSFKCYRRDWRYGACLPSCNRGIHWEDPPQYRYPWSCEVVAPWRPPTPSPPPPGRRAMGWWGDVGDVVALFCQ